MNRLMKPVFEKAWRRGRNLPEGSTAARWRMESPVLQTAQGPCQERLIRATSKAGVEPAAITREVGIARPASR